jgi:quercetin dioxygenase-like cupin family protein
MHVIKQENILPQDATNAPLFYGGKVTRQPIVGNPETDQYSFAIVKFYEGSKNHFHTHTSDQILFATHGIGIVADEKEEIQMKEGDTAFIPAGEKHWHGASDGHDFFHVSLTKPDSVTEMFKS